MSAKPMTSPFLVTGPAEPVRRAWSVPQGQRRRGKPAWQHVLLWLRAAWQRRRTRIALARLDGHLLKDIGVSYAEAEHEVNKPFWRA